MTVHLPPQADFTFTFGTSTAKRVFAFAPATATAPPEDTFSRLFPDVAVLVFEELSCVDRPNPQSLGWMRVALVNHLWRATILGMPQLWARDFLSRGYKRGLQHYLARAQDLPLTLDLQLPREVPDLRRMRELLRRTRVLSRSGGDKAIQQLLEELRRSSLPLLEEVSLSCREQVRERFYLKESLCIHPNLRTISAHGCCLPIPNIITSLSVSLRGSENLSDATNLGKLLQTLASTPKLQTLTIHFQEFIRGISPTPTNVPGGTIRLPALTELVFNDPSIHTGEIVMTVLRRLDMPSLKRVDVKQAYKYKLMNGGPALRHHDAARELQDLLSYFAPAPCARDITYLALESCALFKSDGKVVRDDAHTMAIHMGTDPPTRPSPSLVWPAGSRSLSLSICYKRNPRHFPLTIAHALEAIKFPFHLIKVLDIDLSPFLGLSLNVERLLFQCADVEKLIIGRQNDHESAHAILQALTPSIPGDANPFRELPFQSELPVLLPRLRTVELPSGNVDRIHFVELLTARYVRKAPLGHFIIPGEELEARISMTLRGLSGIRGRVVGRLCGFAGSVGATVTVKDTSPEGKPGTCPSEILFNYSPSAWTLSLNSLTV
ncbi:unnamed protein product [Peniophora sp. CBMAI 1063]|nr:unnamed protein product [Peniophora sp. CBMAI 1063]